MVNQSRFNAEAHGLKNISNSTEPRMKLYTAEVQKALTADNSFLQFFRQDTALAKAGATNNIPQSAALPAVTVGARQPNTMTNGQTANKGTVKVRRNENLEYPIEYFSTDPMALEYSTDRETMYNRTSEALISQADAIKTSRANYALVEVAQPNTNKQFIIPTTGSNRKSEVDGTTNVRAISWNDLTAVKKTFHQQNILANNPSAQIYAVISPQQWEDIAKIENVIRYDASGRAAAQNMINSGIVGEVLGIKFMFPRQNTDWAVNIAYNVSVAGTFTKKALGSSLTGSTDTGAALFFVGNQCWKAESSPRIYSRINDPEYFASIYAMEQAFGATRARKDGKGVVMLSETLGS